MWRTGPPCAPWRPRRRLREVFEAVLFADVPVFSAELPVGGWLLELAYVATA